MEHGFTLVELMIVVAVLGIPEFSGHIQQANKAAARDTACVSSVRPLNDMWLTTMASRRDVLGTIRLKLHLQLRFHLKFEMDIYQITQEVI